jgi:hypothetical protein
MKRSTERILTTHVGSLARPEPLIPLLRSKDRGQSFDQETFAKLVRDAVADVGRRQTEAGIDVVTDGEQGKASFFGYIVERFNGFARTSRTFRIPSGDMVKRLKDNPRLGAVHLTNVIAAQGALPIMVGVDVIGAAGVSGAVATPESPGGVKDEACVKAGLDKVADQLK